jgi:hypothetical protein
MDCVKPSIKNLGILSAVLMISTGVFSQNLYVNKSVKPQSTFKAQENNKVYDRSEIHSLYEEKSQDRELEAEKMKQVVVQAVVVNPSEIKVSKNNTNSSISRGGLKITTSSKSKVATATNNKSVISAQKIAPSNTSTSSNKTDDEKDLFCRLVNAEAGGESLEGKLAVATVIINRVKSGNYPNTIKGVIYDENWGFQFTPVLDGRINIPASDEAVKAVNMVLDGYRSFDASILYFLNPKKAESPWIIKNKTFFKSLGNHDFYY